MTLTPGAGACYVSICMYLLYICIVLLYRFDDIQEDIDDDDDDADDDIITHHGTITIMDDIGDQQEILEV